MAQVLVVYDRAKTANSHLFWCLWVVLVDDLVVTSIPPRLHFPFLIVVQRISSTLLADN